MPPIPARAVRDMFGAIARRYDLLNRALSVGRDRVWRERGAEFLAQQALERPPQRILDVCCGTGKLAEALHTRFPGAEVVATDFCREMVAIGVQQAPPAVRFRVADTLRLPFADARFDAITVAFGIRNVADYRAGLREMVRVVRPGGQVLILEFTLPRNRVIRAGYLFYFTRVLPALGRLVSSHREAYSYLPATVLAFASESEFRASMEAAGLTDVRQIPLTLGVVTLHWGRVGPGQNPKS